MRAKNYCSEECLHKSREKYKSEKDRKEARKQQYQQWLASKDHDYLINLRKRKTIAQRKYKAKCLSSNTGICN